MLLLMTQTRTLWITSIVIGTLSLFSMSLMADDHAEHAAASQKAGCQNCGEDGSTKQHSNHTATQPAKRLGSPYTLGTDPVSGEELPEGKLQIIIRHDGRELRFGGEDTLEKFKADPDKYLGHVDEQLIAQQLPHYPVATCIISGEKLGGDMGEPINFLYKNRLVRFCCKGCKKEFLKHTAEHLQKLDEAAIAAQLPHYPLTTCMISGEELGGDMGEPLDRIVGNRLVRFCCKGCVKKFYAEPAKYLAILNEAANAMQEHSNKDTAPTKHHDDHEHGEHSH